MTRKTDATIRTGSGAPVARRRLVAFALARATLATACLVALYYLLPLDQRFSWLVVLELTGGVAAIGALVAWQVRSIVRSPAPRLRAIVVVAIALPLFLLLFAATYYLMDRGDPGSFTQPMTRTDALYFTVTVFATVGFGDIAPVFQTARIVTTVQMIGDLVLVGAVAHILVAAVQLGLDRQAPAEHPDQR